MVGPHAYDDYEQMLLDRMKNGLPTPTQFVPPVRYVTDLLDSVKPTPKKVKHRSGASYRQRQARHRKTQRPPKEALR